MTMNRRGFFGALLGLVFGAKTKPEPIEEGSLVRPREREHIKVIPMEMERFYVFTNSLTPYHADGRPITVADPLVFDFTKGKRGCFRKDRSGEEESFTVHE